MDDIEYGVNDGGLEELLLSIDRPGEYCAGGRLYAAMPKLTVEGVGDLSFPVPESQLRALIAAAHRAPYGKGSKTLVDTSVRDCRQIDADKIRLAGLGWRESFNEVMDRVARGLGLSRDLLDAELYKLLRLRTRRLLLGAPRHGEEQRHGRDAVGRAAGAGRGGRVGCAPRRPRNHLRHERGGAVRSGLCGVLRRLPARGAARDRRIPGVARLQPVSPFHSRAPADGARLCRSGGSGHRESVGLAEGGRNGQARVGSRPRIQRGRVVFRGAEGGRRDSGARSVTRSGPGGLRAARGNSPHRGIRPALTGSKRRRVGRLVGGRTQRFGIRGGERGLAGARRVERAGREPPAVRACAAQRPRTPAPGCARRRRAG